MLRELCRSAGPGMRTQGPVVVVVVVVSATVCQSHLHSVAFQPNEAGQRES